MADTPDFRTTVASILCEALGQTADVVAGATQVLRFLRDTPPLESYNSLGLAVLAQHFAGHAADMAQIVKDMQQVITN